MHYKITTLVENAVYGRSLQAEHGLSLLIENNRYKILFDTGQSDLFIRNATLSDIDIAEVDFLILSHGHSDHTGGLRHFLAVNKKSVSKKPFTGNLKINGRTESSTPTCWIYPASALSPSR